MSGALGDVFAEYVAAGGFVMPPLIAGALVLWYAIGYRYMTMRRGSRHHVRTLVREYRESSTRPATGLIDGAVKEAVQLVSDHPHNIAESLRCAFFPRYQELRRGRAVITGIVMVAPLIGLLGTVAGMIETFDSLGDMTLFSQSGGIAGGISQALFSTQMGLCVAIPGVIVGRLLDRRQHALEDELDQIKALLGAQS
jgi:biopolymer transport protein ExbB